MTAQIYEMHTFRRRGWMARWGLLPDGSSCRSSIKRVHTRGDPAPLVVFPVKTKQRTTTTIWRRPA